jgi:3-hydroxyacyl-CoA dehydrogenase/enoyl-CoA hydratase/3-hydroxybutyryl-CoA epimerase
MSYIDTLGLSAFIAQCEAFVSEAGSRLSPSDWLRNRARENDRIYPRLA